MKKTLIALLSLLCLSTAVSAQQETGERRYGLFDRKKYKQADKAAADKLLYGDEKKSEKKSEVKASKAIDEKYLAGSCPEVNGKVQWDKQIALNGLNPEIAAKKVGDWLKTFVKEQDKTNLCKITYDENDSTMINARIQEWLVFERKPLSLDQTLFNYQLFITFTSKACQVSMRHMSYIYEEDRGGGYMPAEDMLSDSEALTKTKDAFHKGGYKKFRTKTIDRKDEIFKRIETLLTGK